MRRRPRHDGDRYLGPSGPRPDFRLRPPVSWRQIESGIRPDAFAMEKPPRR